MQDSKQQENNLTEQGFCVQGARGGVSSGEEGDWDEWVMGDG